MYPWLFHFIHIGTSSGIYLLVAGQKFTDVSEDRPFEGRSVSKAKKQKGADGKQSISLVVLTGFFLVLHFDPDDGGSTILRNVSEFLPNCMVLHPRG